MIFDTRVAIVLLDDLPMWQKLNVTAFLATGIAGAAPDAMENLMSTRRADNMRAC